MTQTLRLGFLWLLVTSFAYYTVTVSEISRAGGDSWLQGDWLINSENGPIRRSLTGDVTFWIAERFQLDALFVISVLQYTCVAALYGVIARIVAAAQQPVLYLLGLSHAFFVLFWMANLSAAGRKEVLVYLALALFCLGLIRANRMSLIAGCLMFLVAVAAHEALFVFAPVFLAMTVLARPDWRTHAVLYAGLMATFLAATGITMWAFVHANVANPDAICVPLLERGFTESFCQGAIRSMHYTLEDGLAAVRNGHSWRSLQALLIGYITALAPFLYMVWLSNNRPLGLALALGPLVMFAPLYLITIDYGRWMSFHIFASFILCAIAFHAGRIALARPFGVKTLCLLVVVALTVSHTHIRSLVWGGVLRRVWDVLV